MQTHSEHEDFTEINTFMIGNNISISLLWLLFCLETWKETKTKHQACNQGEGNRAFTPTKFCKTCLVVQQQVTMILTPWKYQLVTSMLTGVYRGQLAPGTRNKFGAPMFEPKLFREQLYWRKYLRHYWGFLAPPSDSEPGTLYLLVLSQYAPACPARFFRTWLRTWPRMKLFTERRTTNKKCCEVQTLFWNMLTSHHEDWTSLKRISK